LISLTWCSSSDGDSLRHPLGESCNIQIIHCSPTDDHLTTIVNLPVFACGCSRVQSPKRSSFLKNMAPEVASEGHQNPELATSWSDANGDTETYVQDCGSNIPSVSSSDPTSRNGINLSRFENSLSRSSSSSSGGSSTTTYRQYSSTTSKYRGASKMVNTSGEEGTDDIVRSDRGSRGVARG
jgi:hypothetical protein